MNASNISPNYHLRVVPNHTEPKELKLLAPNAHKPPYDFTDREVDILSLMADGLTAEMVAEHLCISHHTVKTHQRNMLKKTGCSNGIQLVARSIRAGII